MTVLPGMRLSTLTSLQSFKPHAAQPVIFVGSAPPARHLHSVVAAASSATDVLGRAERLQLPEGLLSGVEEYLAADARDWHLHPGLLKGCEPGGPPLRVAVLLSGGVDSSLALQLLCAAGHRITAFYLQIWFQEDFANFWDACPWEEDLQYCRAVCERLGVDLEVVPLTQAYWEQVVAHSIAEIRVGRTPNPDILCNSRVKFGAFLDYLESEHSASFDRVASGHYARLERGGAPPGEEGAAAGAGAALLQLTPDALKDQTYFLAHLTPAQISRTLFPLGHLTKPEVRALAAAAALPNSGRKDSQGICFLGHVKFGEFVRQHLGEWPGPIVEAESGEVLGYHRGFWFHTVGQRKGIMLSGGPWYVTEKDPDSNAVYVSRQYYEGEKRRDAFSCDRFSWTTPHLRPDPAVPLQCKVRHGPHLYGCTLEVDAGMAGGRVTLDGNDQGLAPGQYVVFYQRGVCLGCATICAAG